MAKNEPTSSEAVVAAGEHSGDTHTAADTERPSSALPAVLNKKKLQKMQEQYERRGIVYISRIPPHMKPQKLRQLLEPYGQLGRLYLALEDPRLRRKRKEKGANTGKNFTEGWVEFEDKQNAKDAVQLLNGQPMGGKRRSAYFYDLWCLRYLPKFKWDHLTEEINYQKAIKEQRMAVEVSAAKRERDFYLAQVDASKAQAAMLERRREVRDPGADAGGKVVVERCLAAVSLHVDTSGAQLSHVKSCKQFQMPLAARAHPFAPLPLQRSGAEATPPADPSGGMPAEQPQAADKPAKPVVVRRYGQRKPKADPILDDGVPSLSGGLLKQLAGRKRPVHARS
ncbi:hypothetical protein ACKKBF_B16145 [Auxenochlorella protothecoides x Auxenochlorella symbiontica]